MHRITRTAYRESNLAMIGPNSHEKLTKYEITGRSSYYLLKSAFMAFYLPLFGLKIKCLCIFNLTYRRLPLFASIWPYLALITLIWSYLP